MTQWLLNFFLSPKDEVGVITSCFTKVPFTMRNSIIMAVSESIFPYKFNCYSLFRRSVVPFLISVVEI